MRLLSFQQAFYFGMNLEYVDTKKLVQSAKTQTSQTQVQCSQCILDVHWQYTLGYTDMVHWSPIEHMHSGLR